MIRAASVIVLVLVAAFVGVEMVTIGMTLAHEVGATLATLAAS